MNYVLTRLLTTDYDRVPLERKNSQNPDYVMNPPRKTADKAAGDVVPQIKKNSVKKTRRERNFHCVGLVEERALQGNVCAALMNEIQFSSFLRRFFFFLTHIAFYYVFLPLLHVR